MISKRREIHYLGVKAYTYFLIVTNRLMILKRHYVSRAHKVMRVYLNSAVRSRYAAQARRT